MCFPILVCQEVIRGDNFVSAFYLQCAVSNETRVTGSVISINHNKAGVRPLMVHALVILTTGGSTSRLPVDNCWWHSDPLGLFR